MIRVAESRIKSFIHQSNLIEGFDNPEFDAQGLVAWHYLLEVAYDQLDHHCIKKVQKIVTLRQTDLQPNQRGYYRGQAGNNVNVRVGLRLCPSYTKVQTLMDNWLTTYMFTIPQTAHVEFEKIHPFVDGNGRTGRLLMWWQQMHRGDPLTEITFEKRNDYYQWFNI